MNVIYMRVSSTDQNLERQQEGLAVVQADRVFQEKASGKSGENRPELQTMLDFIRQGDCVHVWSIDRLARNVIDLEGIVNRIKDKGCSVKFHKENLEFTAGAENPFNELIFHVLGSFAQFERAMIHERQREGIAIAREQGRYKACGRKPSLTPEQVTAICQRLEAGEKAAHLAKEYGVSRQTLYEHRNKGQGTAV